MMSAEQNKIRDESRFFNGECMLKKRTSITDLSFKELKLNYSEKDYHLDDKNFEANLNLRNSDGEFNLLAELLADRNNIPFFFIKFKGRDK